MPLGVLLQENIQTVKEVTAIAYYAIAILATLCTLIYFIIRLAIKVSKKVDQETFQKGLDGVVDKTKEELEVFKENHDKEHASLTQRLEDWSKRQNEINADLIARIEESAQNQKGINDKLVEKFDELIPKVTSIETKVDILVRDYESRIKLN